MREIDQKAGVEQEVDLFAVLRDGRKIPQLGVLRLPPRAQADLLAIGLLQVRHRPQMHLAGIAIDDDRVALIGEARGIRDLADGGDPERARDDGDVARRPALFQHHAAQPGAVVVQKRRRAHVARDQHGAFRQFHLLVLAVDLDELAHQAVRQVVEIVEMIAQVGIGLAQHARARVGLHALDGGFRRQARFHRLVQFVQPAAVMREHAVRLEHVAVLARPRDAFLFQHHVDRGP